MGGAFGSNGVPTTTFGDAKCGSKARSQVRSSFKALCGRNA
jgi:hypothetical protein